MIELVLGPLGAVTMIAVALWVAFHLIQWAIEPWLTPTEERLREQEDRVAEHDERRVRSQLYGRNRGVS